MRDNEFEILLPYPSIQMQAWSIYNSWTLKPEQRKKKIEFIKDMHAVLISVCVRMQP